MGGKSSAPPPPDYAAAAQQTAEGNLENARIATMANRVNTYTPYGNLTYSQDPNNQDKWSANIALDPDQQRMLAQQNETSLGLGNLQNAATSRVGQSLNSPYAQTYDPQRDTSNAQQLIMNRLEPQFERQQANLENQLINQGLQRGSEAWNNALGQFGQTKNDAYSQAALQGINLGAQQQQQQYQQEMAARNAPLNELSAIRSGSQVTNPTFQNFSQQQNTAAPDMLGAANSQYQSALGAVNASNAASGNFMNGLMGLGASWLGG